MTEKRFTEIVSTQKVIDNQTGKEYNCLIDDDLLKLLNELHEGNEQLKQENNLKGDFREFITKDIQKTKEENQRLIKMLDNVANYMQKQHKDMAIDEFVEWWNNIATGGLE